MAQDFVDEKTHEEGRSVIRWAGIKSFLWGMGMLTLGYAAAVFGSIALGVPDALPLAETVNSAFGGLSAGVAGALAGVAAIGTAATFPMSLNSDISDSMKMYEYQASLTGKAVSKEMFKEMEDRGMVPVRKDGKSWVQYNQDRQANAQIERS